MRTSLQSALLILACTLPAAAQEKAKPNTLTPKEIADGWILLFDGETTFGWVTADLEEVTQKERWPDVAVVQGNLVMPPNILRSVTTRFRELEVQAVYRVEGTPPKDTRIVIVYDYSPSFMPAGSQIAARLESGRGNKWGRFTARFASDGCLQSDTPDGKRYQSNMLPKDYETSRIGFSNESKAKGQNLLVNTAKLLPLGTKPLFNGKDLTGWKSFPGKKSQFTVEDGAIHLKNGPGDLQTEGKYANFVLQLECKSNGKYLNSGIFFRCKPNEYQNGYEAQIHNHFTAEPAKDYTIEEYDPKTHELLGKKKVKYAATDYGTGAIYRRIPARKEVAKDGEWFTMTVVAHGNHIATWVNGIQQVDWYDNRPASDNPRNGCRLEAGHISIQGHDPTTDLSFRNIRIAELPAN